jgi:hypothetical protein
MPGRSCYKSIARLPGKYRKALLAIHDHLEKQGNIEQPFLFCDVQHLVRPGMYQQMMIRLALGGWVESLGQGYRREVKLWKLTQHTRDAIKTYRAGKRRGKKRQVPGAVPGADAVQALGPDDMPDEFIF